jgi:ParB-like chromosome segregation protein Spo0J
VTTAASLEIQVWPIDRLVLYARNPRQNDAVVNRMCSSIREFGFKIPVLARSDGEVVDGHLRIKAARKLGISDVPVILCDEWSPAQVKAFRLLVNRSVTWASWDEELLALELQELSEADFDLDLTGFNPGEIDGLLALPDEERANATPPVPENAVSLPGDLCFAGRTGYCVEMPRARMPWPSALATGNQSSWLRTHPTASSWTASGVTAPA